MQPSRRLHWVIAGSSGFLGTALRRTLLADGQAVTRLVRRASTAPDESPWDPAAGRVDPEVLRSADIVVNLAGAPIGRVPWTRAYRAKLRASRVDSTGTLARALAGLDRPGEQGEQGTRDAPRVFVAGSAIGWYAKDTGDLQDEHSPAGTGFLASLVTEWEAAAQPAAAAGIRVLHLRSGLVMSGTGGVLPMLRIPFRLGLGGRLGSGRQAMALVGLDDWIAAVRFLVTNPDCRGPYNLVIPNPTTNAEFTKALGAALGRPTVFTVPAPMLRLALGEFSAELLGSIRLVPKRLLDAGFEFSAPDVRSVLDTAH